MKINRDAIVNIAILAAVIVFQTAASFLASACAAPEGGEVVAGSAVIDQSQPNITVINTTSPATIMNFTGFNTTATEVITIAQPGSSSLIIGRISGGSTSFNGSLTSNGSVYLLNPDGVLFGPDSEITGGSITFTPCSDAPASYDITEYFPAVVGDMWEGDPEPGYASVNITGTQVIDGVTVIKIRYPTIDEGVYITRYYKCDSSGLDWYGFYYAGDSGIFSEPIALPRNIEAGETYTTNTCGAIPGGTVNICATYTVAGLEDVALNSGFVFKDALKITLDISSTYPSGDVSCGQESYWLVKNIGIVKLYSLDMGAIWIAESGITHYSDGLRKAELLGSADSRGGIYYEYLDEDFGGRGYGRVVRQARILADSDGAKSHTYEYYAGMDTVKKMISFQNTDFTTMLAVYEYDASGNVARKISADGTVYTFYLSGNRESMTLPQPDSFGRVYLHYIDENPYSQSFGMMDKEVYSSGRYSEKEYYGATSYRKAERFYRANGELWLEIRYSEDGITAESVSGDFSCLSWEDAGKDSVLTVTDQDGTPAYVYHIIIGTDGGTDILETTSGAGSIYASFGNDGLWKYSVDRWTRLTESCVESFMLSEKSDSGYDLIGDFGSGGMWKYSNGRWSSLTMANSESFLLSSLNNGNGSYDIIGDFGSEGLWKYSGGTWSMLTEADAKSFIVSGIHCGGAGIVDYEIIGDFGSGGFWRYYNSAWTKLSGSTAESYTAYTPPGYAGGCKILADFGGDGLWQYASNFWTMLTRDDVESYMIAENMTADIIGDFGSGGLWRYSGDDWIKLTAANAESFALSAQYDDEYDLIGDFGSGGLWSYSNNSWMMLTMENADNFQISDIRSDGAYDIIGDFGSGGLWKYSGSEWAMLSAEDAKSFSVSYNNTGSISIGGDNPIDLYDIVADFGEKGMWKYSNNMWSELTAASPDPEVTQKMEVLNSIGTPGKVAPLGYTTSRALCGGPASRRIGAAIWK